MPSRKQRKRREKERRHEYELVVVDESGEERAVEAAELRAERRSTSGTPAKAKTRGSSGAAPRKTDAKGRPIREVKPPSWKRIGKLTGAFGVLMFLVLSFVGGKNHSLTAALAPTVLYTVLFAPFLYLIDRAQYRQYLKRTDQQPPPRPGGAPGSDGDDDKSLLGGLRRTLRR